MLRLAQHGTCTLVLVCVVVACTEARHPTGAGDNPGTGSEAGRGAILIDSGSPGNEAGFEPAGSGGSGASDDDGGAQSMTGAAGSGTGGAHSTMGAAGSGSGATECLPIPCPSGAPWNAQTCKCDSGQATGGDSCLVDSDCALVWRGCCSCGNGNPMWVIATHRERQQEVQDAECHGQAPCHCPVWQYEPLAPIFRASCVEYKCAAVDLRQAALSKCSQDSDCVAEGLGCCGAVSELARDYVGINKSADDSVLQCVPAPPCVPTPALGPPPVTICADDGHCAVLQHETDGGHESTTCYSPWQNLDQAYDGSARGCDCVFDALDRCRQDSMGRFLGLLCGDGGHWQAVNDGPCGMP
jgi:hypothetical protein